MSRRPRKLSLVRQQGGLPRGDDPSLPAPAVASRRERAVLRLCAVEFEWRTLLRERSGGWAWLWTDPARVGDVGVWPG